MFGFPTQTRHLYLHEPRRSHPWPPEESVDRDLRLAISEFAPGNEIVREKIVLTPVGLAGFRPTGVTPRMVPALGPVTPVGLCEVCGAIDPAPGQACAECGAQAPYFRIEQLSRPAGFRTSWSPADREPYEGVSQRLSRASTPKLAENVRYARTGRPVEISCARPPCWGRADASATGFHPILDWRLAADALDLLLDGQLTTDRWASRRTAAVRGVTDDFGWTILDPGDQPIIDTDQGLIVIVHPFAPVDGQLTAGVATPHGPALPFDIFNFDRRPGEVYRRL